MLNGLELRVVALLADALSGRAHLTVHSGPAPGSAPAAGAARLVVSVGEFGPDTAFMPERIRDTKSPPESRRVLGLNGIVRLLFQIQPATVDPAASDAARTLLLEDMSLAVHALANPPVASGSAFATGNDAGFRVASFVLEKGNGAVSVPGIAISGEMVYRCHVEIWPPAPPEGVGVMGDFSRTIVMLPLQEGSGEHAVPAGRTITLRVRSLPRVRPGAAGQSALPLRVAVKVLSAAPPAARGTVTSGVAGVEAGVRVVPVADPETSITFQAPALASGERTEYVALHYATPEGKAGVFLGSIAVRIRGGA